MSKKLTTLISSTLLTLVVACAGTATMPEGQQIGEEVRPQKIVAFATVDASPEDYFNKTLLVEATVNAVCQTAGCWMQINDEGATARVRWETGCGGKYAFPKDAAGQRIVIQGSFYPTELSDEDLEHLKEEAGPNYIPKKKGYEFNASAVILIQG